MGDLSRTNSVRLKKQINRPYYFKSLFILFLVKESNFFYVESSAIFFYDWKEWVNEYKYLL